MWLADGLQTPEAPGTRKRRADPVALPPSALGCVGQFFFDNYLPLSSLFPCTSTTLDCSPCLCPPCSCSMLCVSLVRVSLLCRSLPFVLGKGIGPSLPSAPLQANSSVAIAQPSRSLTQSRNPGKADAIAQRDAIAHFENLRNRATWKADAIAQRDAIAHFENSRNRAHSRWLRRGASPTSSLQASWSDAGSSDTLV